MTKDEKVIDKYLDGIDTLKDKVTKNSEKILSKININKLRANPKEYLYTLGKQFYKAHNKELKKATELGRNKAKRIFNGKSD